jgi:paraquat-inducible protein B
VEERIGAVSIEIEEDSQDENIPKEPELPRLKVVHKKIVPWAWVAPLGAVLLAAFLVYRSLPGAGVQILIRAGDGSGIEANSTLVSYRGVRIGIVSGVMLDKHLDHVVIKARLDKSASQVARAKTQFWIVRPLISLSGVKGLETVVSGPYITLRPGSGKPRFEFEALASAPVAEEPDGGLRIQLTAKRLGALKSGSPVFYRDVPVGEVYDYQLAENSTFVRLFLYIKDPYQRLIRDNSVFWDASGFDLSVSLLGVKLNAESIKALFTGAIGMATPDSPGAQAKEGRMFELQEEQKGEWLKWAPKIEIVEKGGGVRREKAPPQEGATIKGSLN